MRRLAIVVLAVGCHRPPATPAPALDEPPSTVTVATPTLCEHLRELGCPEGSPTPAGRSCDESLAAARKLSPLPEACWMAATTAADAITCGGLRCQ
jgi:hypothetical protein